jgi:hypothetical protein
MDDKGLKISGKIILFPTVETEKTLDSSGPSVSTMSDGNTVAKAPDLRTHPNIDESPTAPKSHTHPSHESVGRARLLLFVYYESMK